MSAPRLDGELQADGVETLDVRWFEREERRVLALPSWMPVVLRDTLRAEIDGEQPA
jgi:hypothetical protein